MTPEAKKILIISLTTTEYICLCKYVCFSVLASGYVLVYTNTFLWACVYECVCVLFTGISLTKVRPFLINITSAKLDNLLKLIRLSGRRKVADHYQHLFLKLNISPLINNNSNKCLRRQGD